MGKVHDMAVTKRDWTGFKIRLEMSVKVEVTSGWIRMNDLIWKVRGGKGL